MKLKLTLRFNINMAKSFSYFCNPSERKRSAGVGTLRSGEASLPPSCAETEKLKRWKQNKLLAAIDGDSDDFLNSSKNTTNGVNLVDAEYYYLSNRLGSISAILDADNQDRILEYYRYEVFGSATVLPIVDVSPVDGLEDTPLDLNDNNAAGPTLVSSFGNTYLYTARRFDDVTGLYYYRNRYYDPRSGRFITRDPAGNPKCNLYVYALNTSTYFKDPRGLEPLTASAIVLKCVTGAILGAAVDYSIQNAENIWNGACGEKTDWGNTDWCSVILSSMIGCIAAPVGAALIEPWVQNQLISLGVGGAVSGSGATLMSRVLMLVAKKAGVGIPKALTKFLLKLGCLKQPEAEELENAGKENDDGSEVPLPTEVGLVDPDSISEEEERRLAYEFERDVIIHEWRKALDQCTDKRDQCIEKSKSLFGGYDDDEFSGCMRTYERCLTKNVDPLKKEVNDLESSYSGQ